MIKVYLTEKEAVLFKKFKKYYELWEKLFKLRKRKMVFHIDEKGEIRLVRSDTIFWPRP